MTSITQIKEVALFLRVYLIKKEVPFHYHGYFYDLIDYLEISIFENSFVGFIEITEMENRWKKRDRSIYNILDIFINCQVLSKTVSKTGKTIYKILL